MNTVHGLYRQGCRAVLTAALFFAASLPLGAAENTAKGSLTVNGKKTEFLHAYAFVRPQGVKNPIKMTLVLADKPMSAGAVTDPMERSTAQDRDGVKMLVLGFSDDKSLAEFRTNINAHLSGRIIPAHQVTFDTFSDRALKGRAFTASEEPLGNVPGTYSFDVQFNVVAMSTPRAPDAAGAKGWETPQGKVLAEFLRAAQSGNVAALKRVMTAESFKELDGPGSADNLQWLKRLSPDPKKVKFESLRVYGNVSKVMLVDRTDATETREYELRRVGDAWLVAP